ARNPSSNSATSTIASESSLDREERNQTAWVVSCHFSLPMASGGSSRPVLARSLIGCLSASTARLGTGCFRRVDEIDGDTPHPEPQSITPASVSRTPVVAAIGLSELLQRGGGLVQSRRGVVESGDLVVSQFGGGGVAPASTVVE